MSRSRKLADWQASYVRRALELRESLSLEALAKRFGVSKSTLLNYQNGVHKPRHDRSAVTSSESQNL